MQIAFYKPKWYELLNQIVCYFGGKPYSHVEFIFNDGIWCGAERDDGVQYRQNNFENWVIVNIQITPLQENIIREFCNGEINSPYDWWGALAFILPLKESDTAWFCSEFVIAALKKIELMLELNTYHTSPSQLYHYLYKHEQK